MARVVGSTETERGRVVGRRECVPRGRGISRGEGRRGRYNPGVLGGELGEDVVGAVEDSAERSADTGKAGGGGARQDSAMSLFAVAGEEGVEFAGCVRS